jgi:hypothetical protein
MPAPRSSSRKRYRFHALATDPGSIAAHDPSKIAADDEHDLVMAQNVREAYKDASEVVESWQSGCCVYSAGLEPVTC